MAKKYLSKNHAPSYALPLFTNAGENTGFKLAVPHNTNGRFTLGHLTFEVYNKGYFNKGRAYVRAMDAIPASWLIDINHATEEVTA
jgi:hypothetical protein